MHKPTYQKPTAMNMGDLRETASGRCANGTIATAGANWACFSGSLAATGWCIGGSGFGNYHCENGAVASREGAFGTGGCANGRTARSRCAAGTVFST